MLKMKLVALKYKKLIPFITFALVFLIHVLYFKIFVANSSPGWWSFYLQTQLYFVSFSLALASGYGAFAFVRMRETGSTGAVTGSAALAFFIWFTSCCGAPMLIILLGIFGVGIASLILPPTIIALITTVLVSLGFIWIIKQRVGAKLVCKTCGAKIDVPIVHCGPGILGPEEGRLYCPCLDEGHTESIKMPKHCGEYMKYVRS